MSIGVSRALEWRLGHVDSGSVTLGTDSGTADDLAADLRSDEERTLDGMSGHTVDTIHRAAGKAVRGAFALSDNLEGAAEILANFAADATVQQSRLRAGVETAEAAGCTVDEAGRVTPPEGAKPGDEEEFAETALAIRNALDSLREQDARAASALTDLHGSIADYGDNSDPRTAIAGAAIRSQTDSLAALLTHGDDGLASTRLVARGLGPFGDLLGFAAGVYGAPDHEPMSETLAAEGGGLAAGVAGSFAGGMAGAALAGATAGSVVPGAGTVVGALAGAALGAAASYGASGWIRGQFDDQRAGE